MDRHPQQIKREKLVFGFPEIHFAEQRKKLKNLWQINTFYLCLNIYSVID